MTQLLDLSPETLAMILSELKNTEKLNWQLTASTVKSVNNNLELWSQYLNQETIQTLQANKIGYGSFVCQHYLELKKFISKSDGNQLDIFKKLAADTTKARLLLYNDQFLEFLFNHNHYLLALTQAHEFVALALLDSPSKLLPRLDKNQPFFSRNPVGTAVNIARQHEASALLILKEPTWRKRLLLDTSNIQTHLWLLGMTQKEAALYIMGEDRQLLETLKNFHSIAQIISSHPDVFLSFSQKPACVAYLKNVLTNNQEIEHFFLRVKKAFKLPAIPEEFSIATGLRGLHQTFKPGVRENEFSIEKRISNIVTALNHQKALNRH